MPEPTIKKGLKRTVRKRTKKGRWRKKRSDVGKSRSRTRRVEVKAYPRREPDIAFWFDEEDSTRYLVRVREGIFHHQLVQAHFELLVKAIDSDSGTLIGEWRD